MAIYNAVLAHHPEYLEWLYRGFHHNLRGDASAAAPHGCTPKPIPVYRYFQGALSCVFNASTIKAENLRPVDPEMAEGYITGAQTGKPLSGGAGAYG